MPPKNKPTDSHISLPAQDAKAGEIKADSSAKNSKIKPVSCGAPLKKQAKPVPSPAPASTHLDTEKKSEE